ncbi:hypothetical protein [Candidatus Poriferisocius sp.]|uniref:hypothetical protein n=1 Tax=Candidatus Poriferisocius sp. TaxID=3101276 RepID=UPI003B5950DA
MSEAPTQGQSQERAPTRKRLRLAVSRLRKFTLPIGAVIGGMAGLLAYRAAEHYLGAGRTHIFVYSFLAFILALLWFVIYRANAKEADKNRSDNLDNITTTSILQGSMESSTSMDETQANILDDPESELRRETERKLFERHPALAALLFVLVMCSMIALMVLSLIYLGEGVTFMFLSLLVLGSSMVKVAKAS